MGGFQSAATEGGITVLATWALLATSCAPMPPPVQDGPSSLSRQSLAGSWRADDGTELLFDGVQRASWIYASEMGPDTFPLWYRVSTGERPVKIDFPIDSAAAARPEGVALHCIAEMVKANELRIDCEQGGARPQSTYRPTAFGAEAKTFRRAQ